MFSSAPKCLANKKVQQSVIIILKIYLRLKFKVAKLARENAKKHELTLKMKTIPLFRQLNKRHQPPLEVQKHVLYRLYKITFTSDLNKLYKIAFTPNIQLANNPKMALSTPDNKGPKACFISQPSKKNFTKQALHQTIEV